jgi:hypothetical protein
VIDGFMIMVMERRTKVGKEISTLQYRLLRKIGIYDWRKDFLSLSLHRKLKQYAQIPNQTTLY